MCELFQKYNDINHLKSNNHTSPFLFLKYSTIFCLLLLDTSLARAVWVTKSGVENRNNKLNK